MKYTVYSSSRYTLIGRTDDPVEAMDMAITYQIRNCADDVTIEDEDGNVFDKDNEFELFVDGLMEYPSDKLLPISVEEAETNLAEYRKCMDDVPEQLTAEILAYIWNKTLEDDAEIDDSCMEQDLPTETEDPVIKSLQTTLDYAHNRRNDEWDAYDLLRKSERPHLGMLDTQYHKYLEAQSFYEGVTMAIFAAGYSISTDRETCKSTVTK